MLEQLQREQEVETEKVRLHLEATKHAVNKLEENMAVLQQACECCHGNFSTD